MENFPFCAVKVIWKYIWNSDFPLVEELHKKVEKDEQKQSFSNVLQNRLSSKQPADVCLNILKAYNFIKKRSQHTCFPVKFCEIFKNTFFYRRHTVATFEWVMWEHLIKK